MNDQLTAPAARTPAPAGDDARVVPGRPSGAGPDLPRHAARQRNGQEVFLGPSLIGGPRNDEKILIYPLLLTMLQFRNSAYMPGAAHRFGHSMIRDRPAAQPAAGPARRHDGRPGHGHRAAHPGRPTFRPVAPLARDDGSFDLAQLIRFAEQP